MRVSRLYRDLRLWSIGGGADEVKYTYADADADEEIYIYSDAYANEVIYVYTGWFF